MPLPPPFEARLVGTKPLTPTVRELTFERLDGRPMEFAAGQWVNLVLPVAESTRAEAVGSGPATLKRSYSIASPPDGTSRFDIAVTLVQGGPASTWLHAVLPGAVLPVTGPQGFFVRPPATAPPSLMIATGTGVTPIRSMVAAAMAARSRAPMSLLLGVRSEDDVLYGDQFSTMAREHAFFSFEVTLSQPRGPWIGRRGYVQTHLRELWDRLVASSEAPPHVYVCGLHRMVGSVREFFRKDLGLPREQVHAERYD